MVKNGEFNSKIRIFIFELIIITLILNCKLVMANAPQTFEQAKTQANKIFLAHPKTLYCGCTFNEKHQLDLRSCHMQSAININRASRLEWEHIMPAENFGKKMACWKKKLCKKNGKRFKGRRCCERISPKFRRQEAELYNLWPAEGIINLVRSNYNYSKTDKNLNYYGCRFSVDKENHLVEPDDSVKGLVARANLFMKKKYHIKLSSQQHKLFTEWNKKFPPMDWEKVWARKVAEIEGYDNPFIN